MFITEIMNGGCLREWLILNAVILTRLRQPNLKLWRTGANKYWKGSLICTNTKNQSYTKILDAATFTLTRPLMKWNWDSLGSSSLRALLSSHLQVPVKWNRLSWMDCSIILYKQSFRNSFRYLLIWYDFIIVNYWNKTLFIMQEPCWFISLSW